MGPCRARYLEGLTYEGLLPRLWRNRDRVEAFYAGLPPLPPLPKAQRALALVEDWCPDSVQAIPVLARLPLGGPLLLPGREPRPRRGLRQGGEAHRPHRGLPGRGLWGARPLARAPEVARAFLREKKAEGLSPKALLLAYHEAFSRFAEAMLAEWRALLSP